MSDSWDKLSKRERLETILYNYNIPQGSVYMPVDFDTRGMIHIEGEFSFGQLGEIMEAWQKYRDDTAVSEQG